MAKKKSDQPELFETVRNNMYQVPFHDLELLEGFNDREDYGNTEEMAELVESINKVGVRVAIKGYRKGNKFVVIVGHRRFRAGEIILKKYGKTTIYPLMTYPIGTKKADMLLDTLLTNSGKELTPLEKASTVSKLMDEQVPTKEIASALGGVSEVYIKNLQRLWAVPEKAKKLIRDGVVSATLIMGYLKQKGANLEEFIAEIEKQAGLEDQQPAAKKGRKKKQAKVTAKNTSGRKLNSVKEFKRFMRQQNDVFESKAKQAAFEFFSTVVNNKATYTDILEFFAGK